MNEVVNKRQKKTNRRGLGWAGLPAGTIEDLCPGYIELNS